MSEEDLATDDRRHRRPGTAAVVYWLAAGVLYVVLGVLFPPVFLLGFQQSLIFVFVITVLAPHVIARRR